MRIVRYVKKRFFKPKKTEEIIVPPKNNKFIGVQPKIDNSQIIFRGDNNVLICEENVILKDSKLEFNANNSIIYLSSNKHYYKINVSTHNNNVCYFGKNNYFNGVMSIILSEEKNCFIGNDGVFSFGIWIRTADPHLIYDASTNKRINKSKSIYMGDHIWLGQNVLLLKGTQIDSGSIIGANSVVSNKIINNNEIWAGNPVRFIKNNIFWDDHCVHKYVEKDTKMTMDFNDMKGNNKIDQYTFKYNSKQYLPFDEIDNKLNNLTIDEIIDYLKSISKNDNKNRFVRKESKVK